MEIITIEELKDIVTKDNVDQIICEMTEWLITQAELKEIIKQEKRIEELKKKKTFTIKDESIK